VFVAPPALYVAEVVATIKPDVGVAAQNCSKEPKGAFTGEVSASMVADVGAHWVVLGHSERRNVFGESAVLVAEKVVAALASGLRVVLCCGELLAEREAGKTLEVVRGQLQPVIDKVPAAQWECIVLAYEPVWAIGTGKVATPQQAEETQRDIRAWLAGASVLGDAVAARLRVQYGGSVNAKNCGELAALPNVDGFLVGGASLIADDFLAIVQSGEHKHDKSHS